MTSLLIVSKILLLLKRFFFSIFATTILLFKQFSKSFDVICFILVVLFVCCTTPAAVLSIMISPSLDLHLGFQTFRAIANNLELLNFALNFYIYCLCSAEIRRAFVATFVAGCDRRHVVKTMENTTHATALSHLDFTNKIHSQNV